jgi:hypothetical protein
MPEICFAEDPTIRCNWCIMGMNAAVFPVPVCAHLLNPFLLKLVGLIVLVWGGVSVALFIYGSLYTFESDKSSNNIFF